MMKWSAQLQISSNYFIINLMKEDESDAGYQLNEMLINGILPFQNPVCKQTYESLPRIYGAKKKPRRISKAEHSLKHIDYLDFAIKNKTTASKRSLSRYLFSGKVEYSNILHKTKRYLTEHYSPSADEKLDEKSTSHSIKKVAQLQHLLPATKAFQLSDLETAHKVAKPVNSSPIEDGRPKTELQKFITSHDVHHSSAPLNPEKLDLSKLKKLGSSSRRIVQKKGRRISSFNQAPTLSAPKSGRYNSVDQIKEVVEEDLYETNTKLKNKKKGKKVEGSTKSEAVRVIDDRRRHRFSSSVLNGVSGNQTMFKNIDRNNSVSRASSRRNSVMSNGYFRVPQTKDYRKFIDDYKPQDPNFNLPQLLHHPRFRILREEKSVYFGEVNEQDEKDGEGVQVSENFIFEGQFAKDEKAKGSQRNLDGVYIGEFRNGLRHGEGQFKWNNGEVFIGQWRDGMKNGYGKWKSPHGYYYEGEWEKNKQNGKGTFRHRASTYRGTFKDFLKDGQGDEVFVNGDKYIGEYKEGKPHGEGIYTWHSGGRYVGSFISGMRSGFGKWADEKGNVYEGEFYQDCKHGKGTETYLTGEVFQGSFQMGSRKKGTLKQSDGEIIQIAQ